MGDLTEHQADWDVVVVGGSYAGLAAALTLGRARRSVLVIGEGGPRNEAVRHVHGFPTRDGASPAELIAAAEAELERYPSVQLQSGRVSELSGSRGQFSLRFGDHRTTAALVVLATGVNDNPPAIPGLAEHWGRGVFTCPFCDGWEHRDLPIAVVGDPQFTPHVSKVLAGWSDDVTVYPEVVRIVGDGESVRALVLASGDEVAVGAVFMAGMPTPNTGLAVQLGCDVDAMGFLSIDGMGQTTVPGVFGAGDVTQPGRHQVSIAVSTASIAASTCVAALLGLFG